MKVYQVKLYTKNAVGAVAFFGIEAENIIEAMQGIPLIIQDHNPSVFSAIEISLDESAKPKGDTDG